MGAIATNCEVSTPMVASHVVAVQSFDSDAVPLDTNDATACVISAASQKLTPYRSPVFIWLGTHPSSAHCTCPKRTSTPNVMIVNPPPISRVGWMMPPVSRYVVLNLSWNAT